MRRCCSFRPPGIPVPFAVVALLALALALGWLLTPVAQASTAGWDVQWVRNPATSGPIERFSADAGRIVYLTATGGVMLYDAAAHTATPLTPPGAQAGLPLIEGDYVVWAPPWTASDAGVVLYDLSTDETRQIARGNIYGTPLLRGGRVLWTGGTNERLVLNLYDIASDTNNALNEGTNGQDLPLLLNDRWVVWREHQPDGSDPLFAYDIQAKEKHVYPQVTRSMYGLVGDQVVLSLEAMPEPPRIVGLSLFDLRQETFTDISAADGTSIANVATDEGARRVAWTGMDSEGVYAAIYDLDSRSVERIPSPYYSLGPIEIAGDIVLFRGQAHRPIFSDPSMVLFAYSLTNHTLTEIGQLILASFPFTTDGTYAYWMGQVLADPSPHLPPHWSPELILAPTSSENLFAAKPPTSAEQPFADVAGTHINRTAIVSLFDQGVVCGYETPGGTVFRPDEPFLRAQFAKVMVEALGLPVDESLEASFWDVGSDDPDSLYPHEYIAAACQAGLIKGYPDGRFRPYEALSRAQLITLVVRAAALRPPGVLLSLPAGYTSLLGNFDPTHGRNLAVAQFNGLVNNLVGFDRFWDPWLRATRAEGVQVLWNLLRIDLGAPTDVSR